MKIQEQLSKIEFVSDKKINFFVLLWAHISFNKNKANENYKEHLSNNRYELPIEIKFTEEEEKEMKDFFNEGELIENITEHSLLKNLYEKNKEEWEKYWNKNIDDLMEIRNSLKDEMNKFNLSLFEDIAHFFETDYPKKIKIYLFFGDKRKLMAYAHKDKIFVLNPQNYKEIENYSRKVLPKLLHEIIHIYQDKFMRYFDDKKKRLEMMEKTANCFASKGFFIRTHKVDREGKSLEFYNLIINSFKEGKTISDIWDKMMELSDFKYYR